MLRLSPSNYRHIVFAPYFLVLSSRTACPRKSRGATRSWQHRTSSTWLEKADKLEQTRTKLEEEQASSRQKASAKIMHDSHDTTRLARRQSTPLPLPCGLGALLGMVKTAHFGPSRTHFGSRKGYPFRPTQKQIMNPTDNKVTSRKRS